LRVISFVIVLGVAVATGAGYAQSGKGIRYVLTDREALGMVEGFGTEIVAPPQVVKAECSTSGRDVLAGRIYMIG